MPLRDFTIRLPDNWHGW